VPRRFCHKASSLVMSKQEARMKGNYGSITRSTNGNGIRPNYCGDPMRYVRHTRGRKNSVTLAISMSVCIPITRLQRALQSVFTKKGSIAGPLADK